MATAMPTWSYKGQHYEVPSKHLQALRALLTWGEEHGLDRNSFSAAELEAYRGVPRRYAYELGKWLRDLECTIHWVDSEGVAMQLRIPYERGHFHPWVVHRDEAGTKCDPDGVVSFADELCGARFSGLARVLGTPEGCATQRNGVGSHSCDRKAVA